jgi:hypothetical protein
MDTKTAGERATDEYHRMTGLFIRQFALADSQISRLLLTALDLNTPKGSYLLYGMGLQVRQRKLMRLIKMEKTYDPFVGSMVSAMVEHVADFRDKLVHWPSIVGPSIAGPGIAWQHDTAFSRLDQVPDYRRIEFQDLERHSRWLDRFNMDVSFAQDDPKRRREEYLLWREEAEALPPWWEAVRSKLRKSPPAQPGPPSP